VTKQFKLADLVEGNQWAGVAHDWAGSHKRSLSARSHSHSVSVISKNAMPRRDA
jgi:hypothetical protein